MNAFGVLFCMQGVASFMKARQQGSMVIIGSNAANTPRMSIGAFGALKAALHMLVKCIGMELAPYGIRFNLVSPGSTRTAMQQQLWTEPYGEAQVIAGDAEQFRLGILLNKIAEPADIAKAVLFCYPIRQVTSRCMIYEWMVEPRSIIDRSSFNWR